MFVTRISCSEINLRTSWKLDSSLLCIPLTCSFISFIILILSVHCLYSVHTTCLSNIHRRNTKATLFWGEDYYYWLVSLITDQVSCYDFGFIQASSYTILVRQTNAVWVLFMIGTTMLRKLKSDGVFEYAARYAFMLFWFNDFCFTAETLSSVRCSILSLYILC